MLTGEDLGLSCTLTPQMSGPEIQEETKPDGDPEPEGHRQVAAYTDQRTVKWGDRDRQRDGSSERQHWAAERWTEGS